jgi:hypothetical protein
MTLAQQLACATRELAMRQKVYPKWVADGRMAQDKATHEIAAMEAIVATLQKLLWLEETSEAVKAELKKLCP